MPIVGTGNAGFYVGRIGTADDGSPAYLYFDPAKNQYRPVIVPSIGNPYYAPPDAIIRRDIDRLPLLASTVTLGAIGAILGGGVGAAVGAAIGAAISKLSARKQNGTS